jgi:hypothetical protein
MATGWDTSSTYLKARVAGNVVGEFSSTGLTNLANPLNTTNGGTGLSTITTGDLLIGAASNALTNLAIGSTNQVLTVVAGAPAWTTGGGGSGGTVNTIGTINGATKSANGLVIGGSGNSTLFAQTADATNPGLVSTGTQTLAGNKTFTGVVNISGLSASEAVVTDGSSNLVSLPYAYVASSNALVLRDANGNSISNNTIVGTTTTASTGSPTQMTVGSAGIQLITGGSPIFYLPDSTTLVQGWNFSFINNGSGSVVIKHWSNGTTVYTMPPGSNILLTNTSNASQAGTWDSEPYLAPTATSSTSGSFLPGALSAGTVVPANLTNSFGVVYQDTTGTLQSTVVGTSGQVMTSGGAGFAPAFANTGTVSSVSVVTANGISGTVATSTTTPAITLTLGAITPTSVTASGLSTQYGSLYAGASGLISETAAGTDQYPLCAHSGSAPTFQVLATAGGGTGQSGALNQYGAIYASTNQQMLSTAAGTTGQFLGANTGAAPTWQAVSGGTSTPTANTIAKWDANVNMSANSFIEGYATFTTSQVLTVSSPYNIFMNGTNITVTLPVVSTLVLGQQFSITNLNSTSVSVFPSGGSPAVSVVGVNNAGGGGSNCTIFTCILLTGTTNASWTSGNAASQQYSVLVGNGTSTPTYINNSSNSTYVLTSNGSSATPTFQALNGTAVQPTVQRFTSGSGTYTTPAGVQYIQIKMAGGGGGGGTGNTTTNTATTYSGVSGSATTFIGNTGTTSLSAGGGTGGAAGGSNFGAGGTNTITAGSGGLTLNSQPGGAGQAGVLNYSLQNFAPGGNGGTNSFGGAGVSGSAGTGGGAGATNTGAGGGGGSNITAVTSYAGQGGGAGGFIEFIIGGPVTTYAYVVGAGGAGGTTAPTGGAGATGIIEVTEYYPPTSISTTPPTSTFTAPTISTFTSTSITSTVNTQFTFTISSHAVTTGGTYSTNSGSNVYTVTTTTGTVTTLVMNLTTNGGVLPPASGTLTYISGASTGNITYSLYTTQYVTPTSPRSPLYLEVTMVGGGAGGAGGGTLGTAGNGGAGGNSSFGTSLLTANGGSASTNTGESAGAGGTASLGSGPIGIALQGGQASGNSGGSTVVGSAGASTPLGGSGGGGTGNVGGTGIAAISNTGSGGGGGYGAAQSGSGGSAGGYVNAIIAAPSSTYSYVVGGAGSAGSGGTSGSAGGAGGSGFIIVKEFYQ